MTMLNINGIRQPHTRNWSPEIQLNINTMMFASNNPAGPPSCGHDVMKPRCLLVRAHSIAQQDRAAPFAADPNALDEANGGQDDGAPDAYGLIGRNKTDGEGRNPGQEQGCDKR